MVYVFQSKAENTFCNSCIHLHRSPNCDVDGPNHQKNVWLAFSWNSISVARLFQLQLLSDGKSIVCSVYLSMSSHWRCELFGYCTFNLLGCIMEATSSSPFIHKLALLKWTTSRKLCNLWKHIYFKLSFSAFELFILFPNWNLSSLY